MSIIGRIIGSLSVNSSEQHDEQLAVNTLDNKNFGNINERLRNLSSDTSVTPAGETSAISNLCQTKSIQSSIKVSDPVSAAQLETDLKAILRPDEQKNVKIQNGKLIIVDSTSITSKTSSKAYAYLLQAVKSGKTLNYNAVQPKSSVTLSDGKTKLSWEQIRGGATVPVDTNNLKTAKVIDIFVPLNGAPKVLEKLAPQKTQPNKATNSTKIDSFIPFPREIVTAHELLGHGLCGSGRCAIGVENAIRKELNLPERSGEDHEKLPTEKGRVRGSANEEVTVTASVNEEIEPAPSTTINTNITLRPLEPLPKVQLPPLPHR